MTWEQKFEAMRSLVGHFSICIRMRKPGDWYVNATGRNIAGQGFTRGTCGDGVTPQEAIEDDWRQYVDALPEGQYIAVGDRKVRWNGFMWKDVTP